jgi:hypothetical protein
MGDFVQTGNTKIAVRDLATPIPDVTAFNAILQSVLDTNPFACVEYIDAGVTVPGVVRGREAYSVRVHWEDAGGNRVGTATARSPSIAAFTANAAELMGNAPIATAMGGSAVRDSGTETFSCQLRCHDPNGENYVVTFSRRAIRISSYADDAIRQKVETWADTVPALA